MGCQHLTYGGFSAPGNSGDDVDWGHEEFEGFDVPAVSAAAV
jgi:hypothetical protein